MVYVLVCFEFSACFQIKVGNCNNDYKVHYLNCSLRVRKSVVNHGITFPWFTVAVSNKDVSEITIGFL